MKYGAPYWNIKDILPYQRNFNFINGHTQRKATSLKEH